MKQAMQPNRHTRSLILDDRLWDDLHAAYLEAQLAIPGERLSKTDFVERVVRRGLEATRRARPGATRTSVPHGVPPAAEPQEEVSTEAPAAAEPPPKVAQPTVTSRSRGVERLRRMAAGGSPSAIRSAADPP